MDALIIPKQKMFQNETLLEKINKIVDTGLLLDIDQVNWPNVFPKTLPVSVHIAHNNQTLFLYYQVEGEELRVLNTKDFMSVWEDSCVEFFVQRKGEEEYRNFEFNALGVLLASKRKSKESFEKLSQELMSSIERFVTIKHHYKADKQFSDWALFAEIPKGAIGFSANEELSQQEISANFYKCGDETKEPHFISWNPIDTPKPNFHVPQFFGNLTFE